MAAIPRALARHPSHLGALTNLLLEACEEEDVAKLELLIATANADVNLQSNDGSPLFIACRHGHSKIVTALLDAKAAVDWQSERGISPLFIACDNDRAECVAQLVKANATLDLQEEHGDSALLTSTLQMHTACVKILIDAGASVNLSDQNGRTPLHFACHVGGWLHAKMLIEARAKVDARDSQEVPPLFMACMKGHTKCAVLLLEARADCNLQTFRGYSPLLLACESGHEECALQLLDSSADVNQQVDGETPLLLAIEYGEGGHADMVRMLVTFGADTKIKYKGQDAIEIAKVMGAEDIATFLRSHEALSKSELLTAGRVDYKKHLDHDLSTLKSMAASMRCHILAEMAEGVHTSRAESAGKNEGHLGPPPAEWGERGVEIKQLWEDHLSHYGQVGETFMNTMREASSDREGVDSFMSKIGLDGLAQHHERMLQDRQGRQRLGPKDDSGSTSRVDELKARRDVKKKMKAPQQEAEKAAPTAEQEAAAAAAEAALLAELDAEEDKKGGASSSSSSKSKKKKKKIKKASAEEEIVAAMDEAKLVDDADRRAEAAGSSSVASSSFAPPPLPDCEDCEEAPEEATIEAVVEVSDDAAVAIEEANPAPEPEPEAPPEELVCPLTHELMIDPVITTGGYTYERGPIERWLATHDTDPLTGEPLSDKTLRPNMLVRSMCRKYSA